MKTLVVITGPTAVGKTELSLQMAKLLSSPVISADSRQMFRQMTIGTAAPTSEELAQAPHLFVHNLDIGDYYSAAMYEADVMKVLHELFEKQDYALMSGGSMMYVDAVCNGIDDMPTVDEEVRTMMKERLLTEGHDYLLEELRTIDPEYYQIADHKNWLRNIRHERPNVSLLYDRTSVFCSPNLTEKATPVPYRENRAEPLTCYALRAYQPEG